MTGHLAIQILAVDPTLYDRKLAGHHAVDMHNNDIGYEAAGIDRGGYDPLIFAVFEMGHVFAPFGSCLDIPHAVRIAMMSKSGVCFAQSLDQPPVQLYLLQRSKEHF